MATLYSGVGCASLVPAAMLSRVLWLQFVQITKKKTKKTKPKVPSTQLHNLDEVLVHTLAMYA